MLRRYVILLALALCFFSCSDKPRMIPSETLSQIYAQMYVSDQWVMQNPSVRKQLDTALIYDPVFEQFGYTFRDFDYTVKKYLERPDRFIKVFKRTKDLLDKRYAELSEMRDTEKGNAELMKRISGFYDDCTFWPAVIDSVNYQINAEGRDSVRTDCEQKARPVVRDKFVAADREDL